MSSDTTRIGRLVREGVEASMTSDTHARLRRRVVEAATRPRNVASWRSPVFALALVASALVLWLVVDDWRSPKRLSFGVGDTQEGRIGAHYPTAPDAPRALTFSDGSTVALRAGGGARVTELAEAGATVRLELGRADVEVVPRARARWQFLAGPFTVLVVGTSFELAWDPPTETIEIQMHSGTVVVQGPGLPTSVEVSGTERLVRQVPSREHDRATPSEPAGGAVPAEGPSGKASEPETRLASPSAERGKAKPEGEAPAVSWAELSRRGDYAQIVEEAERTGIGSVLGSADASQLNLLADAARYARRPAIARQALTVIRERFSGSPQAAAASFVLGRMHDDAGNPGQALSWYDTYLAEAPGGALAAEAHGRRMLVLKRLGNLAEAREEAEVYLKRYPSGAYARHAQELIGKLDPR